MEKQGLTITRCVWYIDWEEVVNLKILRGIQ